MFNEDSDHFVYTRYAANIEVTEEVLRDFIRQYKSTQVTDFLLNVNALNASFPSKILESSISKYSVKKENNIDVDYSNTYASMYYDLYVNKKLDMYAVWIDELRKNNITPWISFRMNDCHENNEKTSLLLSEFFHSRTDLRRVTHHLPTGYFDRCFDYGKLEVRARMIAFIEETMERYDPDGIELDWQREMFCFRPGCEYEGIKILNDFTRQIKTLVLEYEKKRGHKIEIAVRVPANPDDALYSGFDTVTWAKEGLCDIIIPTPRWETTDNDMPIELWKQLLLPYKVLLGAGMSFAKGKAYNLASKELKKCFPRENAFSSCLISSNYIIYK